MKFSLSWLEEWLGVLPAPHTLAETLTMAGLEVSRLSTAATPVKNIVVGCVRNVEPHPNADRLKVCRVDAGHKRLFEVVCGAPNVREGMYAPFAPAGASIGEREIAETDIRGVRSCGMLCSASELGIGGGIEGKREGEGEEESDGLLDLGAGVAAGTDLVEYLHLNDTTFELDLTPNRADCFSILGLAREVAAVRGDILRVPRQDTIAPTHKESFPVRVTAPSACPRYLARIVRRVSRDARTPLWMKERLRRSGVRALHPVVDVMNYVMLEVGQPLHAFDLDKLEGEIEVRYARAGESLELLGGAHAEFDEHSLLITDTRGPLALAGIVGGAESAVGENTRDILIECAFFAPEAIRGKARSYGLHTDASLRFERGVDPTLQPRAMERACELLAQITGGEFGPVTEIASPKASPATSPATIELRYDALVRRLGVEIERNEVSKMLGHLGCRMKSRKGGWQCSPPPHRFDLEIEEDLIEEVGRLYGYDNITGGGGTAEAGSRAPLESGRERDDRWCDRLVERGYLEVVTYGFVEPDLTAAFDEEPALALSNAISPAMSVMRTTLWPGLLKVLLYNLHRRRERVRIFEAGRCFTAAGERSVLAGLVCGDVYPEQWGESRRAGDFYDLKADLCNLLVADAAALSYARSTRRGLHPGRTADILVGGERVGCLGALAPDLAQQLDITREVLLFELALDVLAPPAPAKAGPVSRYPAVRRDISVTVPAEVGADQILACIRELKMDLLRDVVFFDVYTDKKMEKSKKSMALGLIFQDISSTLSDEICAGLVDDVVAALAQSLNIRLRT